MKNCNDQLLDAMCPIFFFFKDCFILDYLMLKIYLHQKKKQNVKNIPPQCFVSTCKIKWTKFIYKIRCSLRLNLYSISLILQYIFENLTVGLDIFYALNTHFKFCIN